MDKEQIKALLNKYLEGNCTPEEQALLETWYLQDNTKEHPQLTEGMITASVDRIWGRLQETQTTKRRLWPRIAAAASILLFLSAGLYFYIGRQKNTHFTTYNFQHDVAPALNKATLTLANGQKIPLTKYLTGKVAQQGVTSIAVTDDSALTYSNAVQANDLKVQYNTLSTVKGEQAPFILKLADGTKVWLNAASSITYPVAFNGNQRSVAVTGEVYFEVVHNPSKPFRVTYKNQTIEDIGTHFNINAYEDEPTVKTTLFEGSVSVAKDHSKVVLKPGQQALTSTNVIGVKIRDVDTEEAIAWKNGYFYFDHESLQSVMRKVSRWYNVDIEYPVGQKIKANYWGSMSREANVSVVLKWLEVTNDVKFRIVGKKIIVLKK